MSKIVKRNHSDFFTRNNPDSVASSEMHKSLIKDEVGDTGTPLDRDDARKGNERVDGFDEGIFYVSSAFRLTLDGLHEVLKIFLLFKNYEECTFQCKE